MPDIQNSPEQRRAAAKYQNPDLQFEVPSQNAVPETTDKTFERPSLDQQPNPVGPSNVSEEKSPAAQLEIAQGSAAPQAAVPEIAKIVERAQRGETVNPGELKNVGAAGLQALLEAVVPEDPSENN